jgi:hypothetical protein
MNRIKKYFGIFIGIIIFLIITIGALYFIKPDYFNNIGSNLFFQEVTIKEKYAGKIVVENPEVYELMQIACSLTPAFQRDPNLINKETKYYEDFENHFMEFKDHELINKLNTYLKSNPYGASKTSTRLISLNYKIDRQNELKTNKLFTVNSLLSKFVKFKMFLIPENIELIEDFIKKSNFVDFYNQHKSYYNQLIYNYNELCDFQDMRDWLGKKFPINHQSYRIIFSPLTGGAHSTMSLISEDYSDKQVFMFVSAPYESIDSLNNNEFEIKASQMARVVFTEIDHNYVNPLTDKYISELKSSMSDYKNWNHQKNGSYNSKYDTFNEYMTWGVFSLYALDNYSKRNIDTIIEIQSDFMKESRDFIKFPEFNRELLRIYKQKEKPKVEKLYKPMLNWMEE